MFVHAIQGNQVYWWKYPKSDCNGKDVHPQPSCAGKKSAGNISALEACCNRTYGCAGFNTYGFMKSASCADSIASSNLVDLYLQKNTPQPVWHWDADLHLHGTDTIERFNARCLDGSPGGFYYRAASNPSANTKWKFHFMGGGWCYDAGSCLQRSEGLLGSSKTWTPKLSNLWGNNAAFYGLMSASVNQTGGDVGNPFGDWNFVWFAYCDGTSQTSDRDEPLVVRGKPVHMRGRALLDAHLHELEMHYNFLSTATEVIVSGTSAGGMSTFMHSSYIKTQLKHEAAKLVAVPDAGFWWDTLAYGSQTKRPWLDALTSAITPGVWNATLRGNLTSCLESPPDNNRAKCFTQPYAYAYLDVPTFVVQSLRDPANYGFCYHPPCRLDGNHPGTCTPSELTHLAAYRQHLQGNITHAQSQFGARDGHFLTACDQHEESCRAVDWWGITINGQTMNSTFYTWYTQGGEVPGASAIDVDWPHDNTCVNVRHGSC